MSWSLVVAGPFPKAIGHTNYKALVRTKNSAQTAKLAICHPGAQPKVATQVPGVYCSSCRENERERAEETKIITLHCPWRSSLFRGILLEQVLSETLGCRIFPGCPSVSARSLSWLVCWSQQISSCCAFSRADHVVTKYVITLIKPANKDRPTHHSHTETVLRSTTFSGGFWVCHEPIRPQGKRTAHQKAHSEVVFTELIIFVEHATFHNSCLRFNTGFSTRIK